MVIITLLHNSFIHVYNVLDNNFILFWSIAPTVVDESSATQLESGGKYSSLRMMMNLLYFHYSCCWYIYWCYWISSPCSHCSCYNSYCSSESVQATTQAKNSIVIRNIIIVLVNFINCFFLTGMVVMVMIYQDNISNFN